MKKVIAFIAALSLAGVFLTACGSDNAAEETTTSAVTEAEEETAESTEEITDTDSEDETSDGEAEADSEDEISSDETDESEEASNIQFSEEGNPLSSVIEAVASVGEWPYLSEVTDEYIISDYLTLDKNNENYEEAIYMQCPMSANLTEIIVIKAADPDAAKADLEVRQKKAQDTDAFYPDDVERAGSSIVGTSGSYAYFLMCSDSAEAEATLIEALSELE